MLYPPNKTVTGRTNDHRKGYLEKMIVLPVIKSLIIFKTWFIPSLWKCAVSCTGSLRNDVHCPFKICRSSGVIKTPQIAKKTPHHFFQTAKESYSSYPGLAEYINDSCSQRLYPFSFFNLFGTELAMLPSAYIIFEIQIPRYTEFGKQGVYITRWDVFLNRAWTRRCWI